MNENGWNDSQQFANVENIEVLKGSAATLFGRVEPGGIINVITKQPLAKPYYSLNQQFGSFDKYRTSIDASGPLTKDDTLLYRVNASFQSNNSFRDLVSGENVFFAPIIKWNISPKTQVSLELEYQRNITNFDAPALPFDQAHNRVIDNISHRLNFGERNPQETENIFVGMNWSHQFNDDWSIKHLVAYKSNDVNQGYSLIPFSIDQTKHTVDRLAFRGDFPDDTIATNLDLTGHFKTWGLEHTLLFGGDYYRFESADGAANSFPNFSTTNLDNPRHPTPGPFLAPNNNPTTQITDNYGLYAQDQIKLPYHVHVMGGLRYQYVHTTNDAGFGPGGGISVLATDEAVTPRVGLSWQPKSWFSLYGNYTENFGAQAGARAFKAGTPGTPLSPQTAQQWEGGIKTEFLDGRLRATFAYYDLTKQNVATADTQHIIECNGPCSIAVGEVNSHGPELDIQGEILPGWNMIATYASLDVRVTKSTGDPNGTGFEVGNRLQFVPRNVGSLWTTYEAQQGALKGFKVKFSR
jgi:iron complex outermembrane recepter protein